MEISIVVSQMNLAIVPKILRTIYTKDNFEQFSKRINRVWCGLNFKTHSIGIRMAFVVRFVLIRTKTGEE